MGPHFPTLAIASAPPAAPRAAAPHRRAAGFSLIELSVALALGAVVMLALGSAIVLASRALPAGDSPALASRGVSQVLEQFSTDLYHALHVPERSAHAITFTVADRTGDGSPQRMRYAWSGTPGDPLTWQMDDRDPVTVLPAVDAFNLSYETLARVETYPGPPQAGMETVVSSYGLPNSAGEFSVTSSDWAAQFIMPSLVPETLYWQPMRVRHRARKSTLLGGDYWIRLVAPQAGDTPSETVLAHRTFRGGTLLGLTTQWHDTSFTTASPLKPGQPAQLLFRHTGSGGTAVNLQYDRSASAPGGMTDTTTAGGAWNGPSSSRALPHALYGIEYTAGPDQSLTHHHLTQVRFTVQLSQSNVAPLTGAVHLPNRPANLRRYWELDFRHDPTAIDVDASGEADWRVLNPGGFVTTDLHDNGTWEAGQVLRTWPDHAFTEPTVVHVRMRHAAADSGAALAMLYADHGDTLAGPVGVQVQRQSDGRQTVTLLTFDGSHNHVELVQLPGYHDGMIDIRMLVSPAHRSVHLSVEGVDRGTYRYNRVSATGSVNRALNLTGSESDHAVFQHVRVMVGGTP